MDYIKEKEEPENIKKMEELAEKIVKEILQSKKVIPCQLIDLSKFLELYEPYKDKVKKLQFACILEMNYNNLKQRRKGKNTKKQNK